jgi:hypothetical protein
MSRNLFSRRFANRDGVDASQRPSRVRTTSLLLEAMEDRNAPGTLLSLTDCGVLGVSGSLAAPLTSSAPERAILSPARPNDTEDYTAPPSKTSDGSVNEPSILPRTASVKLTSDAPASTTTPVVRLGSEGSYATYNVAMAAPVQFTGAAWQTEAPRATAGQGTDLLSLGMSGTTSTDAPAVEQPIAPQPEAAAPTSQVAFEVNVGQFDDSTAFMTHVSGLSVRLSATGADFTTATNTPTTISMQLVGSNSDALAVGANQLAGKANYLTGAESEWITDVPLFGKAAFLGVYEGIDMVYYGTPSGQLEYDFVVSPGADTSLIELNFSGADGMRLDAAGNLVLSTAAGELVQQAPIAFQGDTIVTSAFTLLGDGRVGFELGDYDASQPLVIDPVISFSTFRGQSLADEARDVAIDPDGSSFVVGFRTITTSTGGGGTGGGGEPGGGGSGGTPGTGTGGTGGPPGGGSSTHTDAFVAKYDAAGQLLYVTYIGGNTGPGGPGAAPGDDVGDGIALGPVSEIDPTLVPYITGWTSSSNYPTAAPIGVSPYQTQLAHDANPSGAEINAFLTKLSSDGNSLLYSTYLGRANSGINMPIVYRGVSYPGAIVSTWDEQGQFGRDVVVNDEGEAWVVGDTMGVQAVIEPYGQFPPKDPAHLFDAFMHRVDTFYGGTTIRWNLFVDYGVNGWGDDYGEWGQDKAYGVTLSDDGDIFVTGHTSSTDIKVTPNGPSPTPTAYQTSKAGTLDKFDNYVVQFDGPDIDATDDLYTHYDGVQYSYEYSTYIGSVGDDYSYGIAVDNEENAYITGESKVNTYPTTTGAYQTSTTSNFPEEGAAIVTKINELGSGLIYSTYLGGSSTVGFGIAVDDLNQAYVTGKTENIGSYDNGNPPYGTGLIQGTLVDGIFPLTSNATDAYIGIGPRAFLTKFNADGNGLLFSTFHGSKTSGQGVAVRTVTTESVITDREAVVAGYIDRDFMYVIAAAQPTNAGARDGFVAKWTGLL